MFVSLQHVSYGYGGEQPGVAGVTWDLERGATHCLPGRSGCGKITLLKLTAGPITPLDGRVLVDGETIAEPHPRVSLAFQTSTLLEWRTVFDNVCPPLTPVDRLTNVQRKQAEELDATDNIYPQNAFLVVAPSSSGISKPQDLKGKNASVCIRCRAARARTCGCCRNEAVNLEIIKLRKISTVTETTRDKGLGHFDIDLLKKGAETFRGLGLGKNPTDIDAVVKSDLIPE
ncbi:MAG: ATP-binding cassette domain-containing protein [Pseudomonadota bacterium]